MTTRAITLLTPLLSLALLACGDKDDDTADTSEYELDDDGDGLSEAEGDCDDADSTVLPGAEELCDGIDNDCDGTIDDGAGDMLTFYADRDGDTFGDDGAIIEACAAPEATSEVGGDCDDLDPDVHPAGVEICNGVDDDCDTLVDDDDDTVDKASFSTWTVDADGDGYGDTWAEGSEACEGPSGTVDNAEDCDDSSAYVNPGAAEVCDSADTDEDCDGLINDEDDSIYVASQTLWYPDADLDGFGDLDDVGTSLCADPSTDELAYVDEATDCSDSDATTHPGASEVCEDGVVNDCDSTEELASDYCAWNSDFTYADAQTLISPHEDDNFSWFAAAGDLDGDGTEDLVIGSPWSTSTDGYGTLYALHGPLTAAEIDASSDVQISGREYGDGNSDSFGVDPKLSDLDGDGYDDVWVGAPGWDDDDEGSNAGAAYLIHGPLTSGLGQDLASFMVYGEGGNNAFGGGLGTAGDHDGDGVSDLMVGDTYDGSSYRGAIYLYSGASTGQQRSDGEAIGTISGADSYTFLGSNHTMVGEVDLNGDGQADVIIGAGRVDALGDGDGGTFVFHGPLTGELTLDDADAMLGDSTEDTSGLGYVVHSGFDWDGDGTEDVAMGAPNSDHSAETAGALYIQLGPVTADLDLASTATLRVEGQEGERLGGLMDSGDLDGDGQVDLVAGSGYGTQTGNSAGYGQGNEAWVILGPLSGSLDSSELSANISGYDGDYGEGFGLKTVVLGDQDGDGADTLGIYDRGEYEDSWFLFDVPAY